MKGSKIKLGLLIGVLGVMLAVAAQIQAQTNRNERQISDNLRRLQDHMSTFRYDLENMLSRIRYREYKGEDPHKSMSDMETAYRSFNDDFRARRDNADGLTNLLREAQDMDAFTKFIDLGQQVNYDWSRVKTALDQLATGYQVSWDWDGNNDANGNNGGDNGDDNYSYSQPLPTQTSSSPQLPQNGNFSAGLSGTYRLNAGESENTREVAERAVLIITQRDRDRIKADLEDKLAAPDDLTIDIRGQQVTINSSKGQGTFTADGVDKYETAPGGRTTRLRATLRGDKLTISNVGDRDSDYTVTFESIDGGRRLRVMRRVTYESMSQTVLAESVYDKTSEAGGVGGSNYPNTNPNNYPNTNPNNYPSTGNPRTGDFIVPGGTLISATLDTEVSTRVSQNNDRFRMTVQTPNEYRGAIIEGYLSGIKRSGKLDSRAQITFNFERIRLRNGAAYEFAGFLQSITNANGEIVKIDTEGVAKGESQTKETVKRGGIGAGIGAIIGGVIGGVKGAVIGATIGAGAGAGSVYVQGRDDLELKPGTTVGIQATAPAR